MILLAVYVFIALGFSFVCSIAEAVILSVSVPHITLLERSGRASGALLRRLKDDINSPLAAILTLNTVAHTVGAAGAGAQAAAVFGSAWVGLASAVLTLLILVFSEIIPKTLGAHYWRRLAPFTAYFLKYLIFFMYPLVKFSEKLTQALGKGSEQRGFSREELAVIAELSGSEGHLDQRESQILQNLLLLDNTRVRDAMTPRSVVSGLPAGSTVGEFFSAHSDERFSRIPLYGDSREEVTGFVLRSDLLLAQARGQSATPVERYRRDLSVIPAGASLLKAFDELLHRRTHIMLVIDEFGGMDGILTMEDVLEAMLGLEIVDEGDKAIDMRVLARRLGKRRAQEMGMDVDPQLPGPRDRVLSEDPGR
ncbi:MAG TPA: hemolysin family protein [Longimicrobiales bacterium]|nr:hemolysin family protein [Longimicrobiales bacterium]